MTAYRTCFIIQTLDWNYQSPGAANLQVNKIFEGLNRAGHSVSLLASQPGRQVFTSADLRTFSACRLSFTRKRGFQLIESAARRAQTVLKLPWFQIFDSLRMIDVVRSSMHTVDLLYERNSMQGFGAALASKRLKLPYVLHVDADFLMEHDFLGIPHTWLERQIAHRTAAFNYSSAHMLTCVSEVTKEHLVHTYHIHPERIAVIPNGTDAVTPPSVEVCARVRQQLRANDRPIVMFTGSFFPWHGLNLLVDAFKLVLEQVPQAQLVLVGDGTTRAETEARVKQAGIQHAVTFTGRVAHDEVPAYLWAADVVTAPYAKMEHEFWGSPMKVFEYMSAGKAVAASRAGQVGRVIVDGQTGLLAEPGDVQGTANAIVRLLRDPALRSALGASAKKAFEQEYTWEKYIQKLNGVFDQAVRNAQQQRHPGKKPFAARASRS